MKLDFIARQLVHATLGILLILTRRMVLKTFLSVDLLLDLKRVLRGFVCCLVWFGNCERSGSQLYIHIYTDTVRRSGRGEHMVASKSPPYREFPLAPSQSNGLTVWRHRLICQTV